MIIRYDSTAALRADYISCIKPKAPSGGLKSNRGDFYDNRMSGGSWYGNESEADTLHKAEVGDTSLVPKAEAYLDQLDHAIETPRRTWERNVAGPFCVVPDVLAGLPTPMRRMVHTRDETSPITILAVTTSSAGIDAETLAKRGTTILALVMALSRIRPVTLQQLTILDGRDEGETVITSEINTHPLDLATACYVLTSAGFARRLTYNLARSKNHFMGGWPREFNYGRPERYYDRLRLRLAADPAKCLIIGAAQLGDELLQQPLVWLNTQIARFTESVEENAT